MTKYRREIDGLRALAVIPVILFHSGVGWLKGGFVGVDVFFVISGYLITSILLNDVKAGKFSVARFYERRFKRILAALTVVVLGCLVVGYFWLPPHHLKGLGKSIVATATFSSNILFNRESGYFDDAGELKPLLHTWSLAVEEQFYVGFPLLIWLLRNARASMRNVVLALLGVLSLTWSIYAVGHNPTAAFFLLPSRGWELLVGALLAAAEQERGHLGQTLPRWLTEVASGLGLILIAVPMLFYSRSTSFPGLMAVPPVLGTALIIYFCHRGNSIGGLVGFRPLVAIGLISYSAYLWHYPLLVFARHRSLGEPSKTLCLTLSGLALGLAWISWKFIETPFRTRRWGTRKTISTGLAVTAGIGMLGLVTTKAGGFPGRYPAEVLRGIVVQPRDEPPTFCDTSNHGRDYESCVFGDPRGANALVLYGDSHAGALLRRLDDRLKEVGIRGIRVFNWNCGGVPTLYGVSNAKREPERCPPTIEDFLEYVRSLDATVVVALRWSYDVYPVTGEIESLGFDNKEGGVEILSTAAGTFALEGDHRSTTPAAKAAAVRTMIRDFAEVAHSLVVVQPFPEVGWDVPHYNATYYLDYHRLPETISTSKRVYLARQSFVRNVLTETTGQLRASLIDPASFMCDANMDGRCYAQRAFKPLYVDDDHINYDGAIPVVEEILRVALQVQSK